MYSVEVLLDSCHVSVRGGPVVFQLGFSVGACDVLVSIFVSGEKFYYFSLEAHHLFMQVWLVLGSV